MRKMLKVFIWHEYILLVNSVIAIMMNIAMCYTSANFSYNITIIWGHIDR